MESNAERCDALIAAHLAFVLKNNHTKTCMMINVSVCFVQQR